MITTLKFLLLFRALAIAAAGSCKAWLVESTPTDMPLLKRVEGTLSSGDVLQWLAGNSSASLEISAQYWQLLAHPQNPLSGDYGYDAAQMQHFGAQIGADVFRELEAAANRAVSIRIVQHSGVFPDYTDESAKLASGRTNVDNRTLLLSEWWGSGIVHTKFWISDRKDLYIGSANNDWKSLTQVKELGIYMTDCPEAANRVSSYFNNLWSLTELNATDFTRTFFDEEWQIDRKVPCWSQYLHPDLRCKSPLMNSTNETTSGFYFDLKLETPGNPSKSHDHSSLAYMSFSPPEIGSHTSDEQAWVDTILSTANGGTMRISTMDWLGRSQYTRDPVYWPALSSAISKIVLSKNATVRLLVAHWLHDIAGTDEYLSLLNFTNSLLVCRSCCCGSVEIKYFVVPGFNESGPFLKDGKATGNLFPAYSRVNHAKYGVSDSRAHISTSNLVWDYFYTTAGLSFGTYNPNIVSQLQQVFDAAWFSSYSISFGHMNR